MSDTTGAAMHTLGLRIPKRKPAPVDSVFLDPKRTTSWIEGLPMASIGGAAKEIFKGLSDFNQQELPDTTRARVVDLLHQPVDYLCRNLHKHYLGAGFPFSRKGLKAAMLSRELNAALATSFKIIIERTLGGQAERFDRSLLTIALHHSLYYFTQVALRSQLAYCAPPENLWREAYSIFAYAMHNQLHQIPITLNFEPHKQVSSIEDMFKTLVLMDAAGPHRLRQSEILECGNLCRDWAKRVKLTELDSQTKDSILTVDTLSDQPPVHRGLQPVKGPQLVHLDLRPLLAHLHAALGEFYSEKETSKPNRSGCSSPSLLRQLVRGWTKPPERRFVRTRLNFELDVIVGLIPLHELLTLGAKAKSEPAGTAQHRLDDPFENPHSILTMDSSLLALEPLEDTTSVISHPRRAVHSDYSQPVLGQVPQQQLLLDEPKQNKLVSVRTLNESAGGYCFDWSSIEEPPRVRVGELVGIAASDSNSEFTLGIVRWLNLSKNEKPEVGLQVLSCSVMPAHVRRTSSRLKHAIPDKPIRALLPTRPEARAAQSFNSIVLANQDFLVGQQLRLSLADKQERLIKLTRLIESSSNIMQFEFEFDAAESAQGSNNGGKGFEDLWSCI